MPYPLLPGCEPFTFAGGDVGVLLLHGFTGSPQGLRPWGEALRDAGLTVHCPCLPGHGTSWEDLATARHPAWLDASVQALELVAARCDRVAVGSLSFGGGLALHLAATRPELVRSVITVNPWLFSKDPRLWLLPLLKHVVPTGAGVGSDIADADQREIAYERVPLKALAAARKLQGIVRRELDRVTQPLLCYVSRQDHVVPPANTTWIAEHVASTDVEVVWLERSYHVATLDLERQAIFDGSIAFVRRTTAAAQA
jgi:carboxylesterase